MKTIFRRSLLLCLISGMAYGDQCDTNFLSSVFSPTGDTNSIAIFNAMVERAFDGNRTEALNEFLADSVYNNCEDSVRMLLDNGASPNAIQVTGGCTVLTVNYMRYQDALAMTNDVQRQEVLGRVRKIRDLLIAKGAHFDTSKYLRRQFVAGFNAYMEQQVGDVIYVYCDDSQVRFVDRDVEIKRFQVPNNPEELPSWIETVYSAMEEWIDSRDWNNFRVAILGPEAISWTTLNRVSLPFEKRGIACSKYAIPQYMSCDASILTGIYFEHSEDPDALLEQLDADCPSGPIAPFQLTKEEYSRM